MELRTNNLTYVKDRFWIFKMEVEGEILTKQAQYESAGGYIAAFQQNIIENLQKVGNVINKSTFDDVEFYDSFVSPGSLSLDRISRFFGTPQLSKISKDGIIKSSYLLEINQQMFENPRVHWGYKKAKRSTKSFCDGACYSGEWNGLGFAGKGVYKYPHGVIYDGPFNEVGEFHGVGMLVYPSGTKVHALWDNGKFVEYLLEDETPEEEITEPIDRRYHSEAVTGFGTPGHELITRTPPMPIPPGCYDVGDGIYIAEKHIILEMPQSEENVGEVCIKQSRIKMYQSLYNAYVPEEMKNFIQMLRCEKSARFHLSGFDNLLQEVAKSDKGAVPSCEEERWIQKFCRRGGDDPVEYNPTLYECYTTGAKSELEEINKDPKLIPTYQTSHRDYESPIVTTIRAPPMFTIYNLEKSKRSKRVFDKNSIKKYIDKKKRQSLVASYRTDLVSVSGWLD